MIFSRLLSPKNFHYYNRYIKFIASLQYQQIDECYEKHHIVPRSHGGNDDKDNIIKLSVRQHYIAHWMLWKAYQDFSMTKAFLMMNSFNNKEKHELKDSYSSRRYEFLKTQAKILYSGENHPYFGKKRPEHALLMSGDNNPMKIYNISMNGENNPFFGKKHTEEYKKWASDSRLGVSWEDRFGLEISDELKKQHSLKFSGENNPFFGKKHTEETIKHIKEIVVQRPNDFYINIGKKLKLRPLIECPHCNKKIDERNAGRWHLDKCKLKK